MMANNNNRVGEAVRARRRELGLSQDRIAALAEVAPTTWRNLEHGTGGDFRELVRRRIEDALGWPHGSLRRIEHDTVDPAVLVDGEDADPAAYTRLADRLDGIERALADLAAAVSHLTVPKRGRVGRR